MDPCCGSARYCFSPCNYLVFILTYLLIISVVNLFCPPSHFSPLQGGEADATALWLCLAAILASIYAALHVRRARARGEQGAVRNLARRCCVLLVVYFAFCLPSYFAANKSLYHDVESSDDGFGTNFVFTGADGVKLEGKHVSYYSSSSSGKSESEILHIPVVMLGGTGINMYGNIYVVKNYLTDWLSSTDEAVAFDAFTFSYRSYRPNEEHMATESNIIGDSDALWKYVRELYPSQRPLLFAHSLGTGPASALLEKYGGDDAGGPSCAGLGMPYSSMSQVIDELGFYTPLIINWLLDSWKSEKRIQSMNPDVPLAILSAGQDELIPPHHQRKVFSEASADWKRIMYDEDAGHNDLRPCIRLHLSEYLDFMESCVARV